MAGTTPAARREFRREILDADRESARSPAGSRRAPRELQTFSLEPAISRVSNSACITTHAESSTKPRRTSTPGRT